MAFSEENKDRIVKGIETAKTIIHWTWIPLILFVGLSNTNPRPSIIKLISPLA
ncbi:putative mitochondrial import receptor subunit tom7 [Meredithblackwellia eburnea MCA 4105]